MAIGERWMRHVDIIGASVMPVTFDLSVQSRTDNSNMVFKVLFRGRYEYVKAV